MPPQEQNKPSTPQTPPPIPPPRASAPAPLPISEPDLYTNESPAAAPVLFAAPKRRNKKLLFAIIIAAIIAILGAIAAVAYTVYQNPEKVVSDAFTKAIDSKSIALSGDFKAQNKDPNAQSQEAIVQFNVAAEGTKATGDVNATIDGVQYGGAFMSSGLGSAYIKIKNVKGLIAKVFGDDGSGAFKTFIDLTNEKWIKFDSSATDEVTQQYSKDQACFDAALTAYSKSKSQRQQVTDVYRENPLFKVVGNGEEAVGGVDSLRFSLTENNSNYPKFVAAIKKTEVFRAIDKCADGEFTKSIDESVKNQDVKAANKTKFELWVSKWQHEITQLKLSSEATAGSTVIMTARPTFGKAVVAQTPTESVSFKDAMTAFFTGFLGGSSFSSDGTQPGAN
jgi:hypothetical protein